MCRRGRVEGSFFRRRGAEDGMAKVVPRRNFSRRARNIAPTRARTRTRPFRPLSFLYSRADYYLINSVYHDCYLYARYFHGESYACGFPNIPLACSHAILYHPSLPRERDVATLTKPILGPPAKKYKKPLFVTLGNRGHRSRFDVLCDFAKSFVRNLVYYASVQST